MVVSILGCQYGNCVFPQKYLVTIMLGWGMILQYAIRHAFNYSLPHIVTMQSIKRNRSIAEVCPDALKVNRTALKVSPKEVVWTGKYTYYVSCSFTIGYLITHIPSGIFCDLYGSRHPLSVGVLGSGLVCAAMPYLILHQPWSYVLIAMGIQGFFQGFGMPALMALLIKWTPYRETSFLVSIAYGSVSLGLYYFWAILAILWYIIFLHLIFSTPSMHPFVNKKEKDALIQEYGTLMPKRIPWKAIFKDLSIWGLIAAQFSHNFILITINSYLTTYFVDIVGMDLINNRHISAIPYIFQFIFLVGFGALADKLINRGIIEPMNIRCIYTVTGNVLSSLFVLLATVVGCNHIANMICFTAALIVKALIFPGFKANTFDRTKNYAGVISAIVNGIPVITDMVSIHLVDQISKNKTRGEWRKVFWLSLAGNICTSCIYMVWCKGDPAKWDYVETQEEIRLKKILKKRRV